MKRQSTQSESEIRQTNANFWPMRVSLRGPLAGTTYKVALAAVPRPPRVLPNCKALVVRRCSNALASRLYRMLIGGTALIGSVVKTSFRPTHLLPLLLPHSCYGIIISFRSLPYPLASNRCHVIRLLPSSFNLKKFLKPRFPYVPPSAPPRPRINDEICHCQDDRSLFKV